MGNLRTITVAYLATRGKNTKLLTCMAGGRARSRAGMASLATEMSEINLLWSSDFLVSAVRTGPDAARRIEPTKGT